MTTNPPIRLLIAEDDYLVNEEIKRSLRGQNIEVIGEASDGEQAVEMTKELKPDVILMDIKMPNMDGLTASGLIQEKHPTPIVILSAHESTELVEQASKVGVGAYLTKPPKPAEIDKAIKIAIARHNDLMEVNRLNRKLIETEDRLRNIFNTSIPICITNLHYEIVQFNNAYAEVFGPKSSGESPLKCFESRPGPKCQSDNCPMQKILAGDSQVVCESTKENSGGDRQYFIVTARPFFNNQKEMVGIVECFQDITTRKKAEMERDKLLKELQKALDEVKTLQGILPICSFCKNIRNDDGYYEAIEWYFHKRSEVDFSHTICPDCMKKHYPEVVEKNKGKANKP